MLSDRQRSFTIFAPTDEAIDKFLSSQPREVYIGACTGAFFCSPTNIGIARGTLSVATLVVVSDGVDWVAVRFSYHIIYHVTYSVSMPGQVLE